MTVVNIWSNLPVNVVDFRSLQSFKKTIHLVDLSQYLIGVYTKNSIPVDYYCQFYYLMYVAYF